MGIFYIREGGYFILGKVDECDRHSSTFHNNIIVSTSRLFLPKFKSVTYLGVLVGLWNQLIGCHPKF